MSDLREFIANNLKIWEKKYPTQFSIIESNDLNAKPHIISITGMNIVTKCINLLKTLYRKEQKCNGNDSYMFGFDTESDKGKVASIQLSTRHMSFVFLISKITEGKKHNFPSALKYLLQDGNILKTGVGIKGDVRAIFFSFRIKMKGAVDLSKIASHQELVSGSYISLKRLAQFLIGIKYEKGIHGVKWSELDVNAHKQMLNYAGLDGYVGYRCTEILYSYLCVKSENKDLHKWLLDISEGIRDNFDSSNEEEEEEEQYEESLIAQAQRELYHPEYRKQNERRRRFMSMSQDGSALTKKLLDKKRKRERKVELDNNLNDALNVLKDINSRATNPKTKPNNENNSKKRKQEHIQLNIV
jgi:hypothetical protein